MAFRVSTYGQNLKTASYLRQNQDTLSTKGSQIAQGGKISDLYAHKTTWARPVDVALHE